MKKTITQLPDVKVFFKRFIDNEDDWNEALSYMGLNETDTKQYKRNGPFFPKWNVASAQTYPQESIIYEERMNGEYVRNPETGSHLKGTPLFTAEDFQPTYELGLLEVMKGVQTVNTSINRLGNPGNATVKIIVPLLENGVEDKTLMMLSQSDILKKDYEKTYEKIDQLKKIGIPKTVGSDASIELSNRRLNILQTSTDKTGTSAMFASNIRTIFKPMDKIQIWFRKKTATGYSFPGDYAVAFTGLLSDSIVSYGGGKIEVTVTAEDMLKWLRLTRVNITPSVNSQFTENNTSAEAFTTIFAKKTGAQIVEELVVGPPSNSTNWLQRISSKDNKTIEYAIRSKQTGNVIEWRPVQFYDREKTTPLNLNDATEELYKSGKVLGVGDFQLIEKMVVANFVKTINGVTTALTPDEEKKYKEKKTLGDKVYVYEIANQEIAQAGRMFKLQTDFGKGNLLIPKNWIADWAPYRHMFQNTFQLWQSDYKFRLDLIREVAGVTDFEFFADASGTVHYRPPLYMLTPGLNYSWMFNIGAKDGDFVPYVFDSQYCIEDIDIISDSFTRSDRDIKTYTEITGQYDYFDAEDFMRINSTFFYDPRLINRYGVRMATKSLPVLAGVNTETEKARTLYAQAWLNRQNASIDTGTITMVGTPELEVGRTVGIVGDKDSVLKAMKDINLEMWIGGNQGSPSAVESVVQSTISGALKRMPVYYISTINHNYTHGKQFTTTLGLTHGRILGNRYGSGFYGFGVGDDSEEMDLMMRAIDPEPENKMANNLKKEAVAKASALVKGMTDEERQRLIKTEEDSLWTASVIYEKPTGLLGWVPGLVGTPTYQFTTKSGSLKYGNEEMVKKMKSYNEKTRARIEALKNAGK